MNPWYVIATAWTWEPSIILGCLALLAGYARWARPHRAGRAATYGLGVLVLFLALSSPLNRVGEVYLFSAHMVQHLLLILAVPPLLLLGLPPAAVERALRVHAVRAVERVLGQPVVALTASLLTIWVWHLPVLYDGALHSEVTHIAEHLAFLVTFTMFWWPLAAPVEAERLAALPALLYLFVTSAGNTVLGAILTFTSFSLYAGYSHPHHDPLGLLHTIRTTWGISAVADQQFGGAVMWAGGMVVFLGVVFARVLGWLRDTPPRLSMNDTVQPKTPC